jgi:hypothetical protein
MRRQDGSECVDEAGFACQRRALRANHRQGNELRIVAVEPRQKTRGQKRRLARAGRAEDRRQPWRRSRSKSPQPVDGVDNRRVAAKENGGVITLLRFQAAIGRAIRFPFRRPRETPRVEPGLLKPALQPREARPGMADMPLLIRAWPLGGKTGEGPGRERDRRSARRPSVLLGAIRWSWLDRSTPQTASC